MIFRIGSEIKRREENFYQKKRKKNVYLYFNFLDYKILKDCESEVNKEKKILADKLQQLDTELKDLEKNHLQAKN